MTKLERKEITNEVFCEYGGTSWTLSEFVQLMNELITKIPPQYRAETIVWLEGGYDEATCLRISYRAMETDEQLAARQSRHDYYEREREQRELAEFNRLSAKFEKDKAQ